MIASPRIQRPPRPQPQTLHGTRYGKQRYRRLTSTESSPTELAANPRALPRAQSRARSIVEIAITAAPLTALWALAWTAVHFGYWWLALLLAVPSAGFLVRLFMIQHDCGHGSFFRQRAANDWVGRVIGVLTLTPYDFWRHTHAIHHATSGHLERRGIGDVDTLTVQEYQSLSFWSRLRYRTYRHPLVMFGIGPAYLFLLQHRLPVGLFRGGWWPWLSVMATNVAIAAIAAGLIWFIGLGPFLLVQLPTILLAGSIGVWLFYVQHQFEMTFWAHEGEWTFQEAALHGSSHYDLPGILRWFTANIGVHHVHHLSASFSQAPLLTNLVSLRGTIQSPLTFPPGVFSKKEKLLCELTSSQLLPRLSLPSRPQRSQRTSTLDPEASG